MLILEINDGNIVLGRGDDVLYDEPGLALIEGQTITFGYGASARSRLHPRGMHDQFWQRMNAEPLSSPGGDAHNQADLVYLHLKSICAGLDDPGEDVVVVTPSTATPEQLSLFLGIAGEAGLNVRAIVDGSIAAAAGVPMAADARTIDFTLHRGIVTAFHVGDVLEKARTTEVPEAGLRPLIEGWVDVVADRFIDETRFDPLRIAATEQQVFDQILDKLRTGQAGDLTVHVEHGGERRRVDVSAAVLADKSDQRIGLLLDAVGDASGLVLSHRAAMVPGLSKKLTERGHVLTLQGAADIRRSIMRHAGRILADTESVKLITSLPALREASEGLEPADPAAGQMQPPGPSTAGAVAAAPWRVAGAALLLRGIAVGIGEGVDSAAHPAANGLVQASFRIEADGRGLHLASAPAGLLLNGEPVADGTPLRIGDALHVGDDTFHLIEVLTPEGEGHGQG